MGDENRNVKPCRAQSARLFACLDGHSDNPWARDAFRAFLYTFSNRFRNDLTKSWDIWSWNKYILYSKCKARHKFVATWSFCSKAMIVQCASFALWTVVANLHIAHWRKSIDVLQLGKENAGNRKFAWAKSLQNALSASCIELFVRSLTWALVCPFCSISVPPFVLTHSAHKSLRSKRCALSPFVTTHDPELKNERDLLITKH